MCIYICIYVPRDEKPSFHYVSEEFFTSVAAMTFFSAVAQVYLQMAILKR